MNKSIINLTQKKHPVLISYLFILTLFFVIFQLVIYAYSDNSYLMLKSVMTSKTTIPWVVWKAGLFYLSVQLVLYGSFVLFVWGVTRLSAKTLGLCFRRTWYLGICLWIISIITILLANQVIYPASFFAMLTQFLIPRLLAKIGLFFGIGILSLFIMLAFYFLIKLIFTEKTKLKILSLIVFLSPVLFYGLFQHHQVFAHQSKPAYPNIIIIGIDALRPDYLGFYGNSNHLSPHIDAFLSKSINFTHSITPLARTFPAWVSILTGQYPKNNHVRFNLIDQRQLSLQYTLPAILRNQGYQTIYATDGRHFSDIGVDFGFDQLIGPEGGANNFLLGTFNDFPLSNLLVNTFLGHYLFPYSYANREAFATYKPNAFVKLIMEQLHLSKDKPLFLCVHFCLPHWPFFWADVPNEGDLTNEILYKKTIQAADKQFYLFMKGLNERGVLKNAVVVLLSDHGEAFGKPNDRLITPEKYIQGKDSQQDIFKLLAPSLTQDMSLSASFSHGTDVLSRYQIHTLLACRFDFLSSNDALNDKTNIRIDDWVSLVDIKPTFLSLLNLPLLETDGLSLLSYFNSGIHHLKPRFIFTESGFTPLAVKSAKVSVKDAVIESKDLFEIVPDTGHIILKSSAIPTLLKTKQQAVFYKDWVLALYPDKTHRDIFVLINQKTGQWTDDLTSNFAGQAPVKAMKKALIN